MLLCAYFGRFVGGSGGEEIQGPNFKMGMKRRTRGRKMRGLREKEKS